MMGGFGSGMGGLGLFSGLISLVLTIGLLGGLVFLGVWLWRRFGGQGESGCQPVPGGDIFSA